MTTKEKEMYSPEEGEVLLHALELLSVVQTDVIETIRFGKYATRPNDPITTNISRIHTDLEILSKAMEELKEIC